MVPAPSCGRAPGPTRHGWPAPTCSRRRRDHASTKEDPMKKLAVAALLAAMFGVAHATVLDFESSDAVSPGYGGLDWTNFGAIDSTPVPLSGYFNGSVSGSHVAFNEFASPATIQAIGGGSFTLSDGY